MRLLITAVALALISLPPPAHSTECSASIITGIDISASISQDELLMQLEGISAALQSPVVLSAMQNVGCANIAVFVWSDIEPVTLLPWTVVGNAQQAQQASAQMIAAASDYAIKPAQLTNVGSALQFAWQMLGQIPPSGKQVVNIISNGESNQGLPVQPIRDAMHAAGITVNAVLFGPSATINEWYGQNVVTGRGRFVMRIDAADDMAAAFRSKFVLDLAQVQ